MTKDAEPSQYDFFLAHAGPDTEIARRLFSLLKDESSAFLDAEMLRYGDDWDRELALAQRQSRVTVVLVSSRSDQAFYAREEIAAAIALAREDPASHRVVPVYLEITKTVPYGLRLKHSMHVSQSFPLESVARELLELGTQLNTPKDAARRKRRIDYAALQFEAVFTSESQDELYALAFSSQGKIAAGSRQKILLWSRDRPAEPTAFEHDSLVYSVAFSSDGEWLASGSEDGKVRVYRVDDGSLRWPTKHHDEAVYSVAFSRDDSRLASGSYDHLVKLWDARTGRPQPEHRTKGRVTSVAFSPVDPSLLAIADLDDTVTLWDGRVAYTLKGHTSSVETVAFSPDGRLVASAGLDKIVRCWDVERRRLKWQARGHEYLIRSVCFTPDGQAVASASWDKTVRLWNAESGAGTWVLPWDELKQDRWHTDWIWSVAFSEDGMLVATGGSDGKLILLRVEEPDLS